MNTSSQVAVNALLENADRAEPEVAFSAERRPVAPACLSEGELMDLAALEVAREWSGGLAS